MTRVVPEKTVMHGDIEILYKQNSTIVCPIIFKVCFHEIHFSLKFMCMCFRGNNCTILNGLIVYKLGPTDIYNNPLLHCFTAYLQSVIVFDASLV